MTLREFALEDRFVEEHGTVAMSGVQALVRAPLDQHRTDKAAGLNTATLISGYRGSPLGGFDLTLEANQGLLERHNVRFLSGLNEDLGATAVFGAQMANLMPDLKYDGVLGIWYGKAPGVDRSGDAFKHGNFAGVGRNGGVLAICGDDPADKSSTLPSQSEFALLDAQFPILYPGSVQEILDFSRVGFALSRYSGLWVGLKIVTNVADEYSTVEVGLDRVRIVDPGFEFRGAPWKHTQDDRLIAPFALEMEREMQEGRIEAARRFVAANDLIRVTGPARAWLGIVSAGKTYYDVREALARLGLDDGDLARYGVRLIKPACTWPLPAAEVKAFAAGLEQVLVIEEKRPFLETFIKEALYDLAERPTVVGKRDEAGAALVPGYGELDADSVIELLHKRLVGRIGAENLREPQKARITLEVASAVDTAGKPSDPSRTPYFCSGCPHNRSTLVPEGSVAGGGIGCHGMALLVPARHVSGTVQMGGEGVQWVGASSFVETPHRFQNLGDGTFFHSGSLAVRQAVAANTNLTFKILYNGAVAMTGGQKAQGEMPVPELTRWLDSEGVVRTLVLTNDRQKYPKGAKFAPNAEVWERERLDEAQRLLRDVPGVTALIYDQPCAAETRRKRRRGLVEDPTLRVFINEAVCEGCGDCGAKSNCMSVQPTDTEFGRKTQIHQSSCNKDYSCLEGDCPAFITVIPTKTAASKPLVELEPIGDDLPEPLRTPPVEGNVFLMGIGGTGVVTVNQTLATAALIDGKYAAGLDQTGLAQKGGPVVSNLKVTLSPLEQSNRVGLGQADAYLVFDVLSGASKKNLDKADPARTIAVVSSSEVPTGAMVSNIKVQFPEFDALRRRIDARSRAKDNLYFDAELISRNLFRSHMPANLIVVGAAYQLGGIPISAEAIEKAIELNGVQVELNRQAFRVGRKIVAEPGFIDTLLPRQEAEVEADPEVTGKARRLVDRVGASGELLRLLEIRTPELVAYQSSAYAKEYVEFVAKVRDAEARAVPGQSAVAEAVARHLFKLMAYKDEYEVARLHLSEGFAAAVRRQFGEDAEVTFKLHPPMLRRLGVKDKIGVPAKAAEPMFRALAKSKRLRGTALDPFGRTEERRTERALIGEYRAMIERALTSLSAATHADVVKLAALPDMIRGYEQLKMDNVAKFREEAATLEGKIRDSASVSA
ncbi:MAG: indolepyruvate ferredoxin oxidoreductase family protein [Acidimicrobiales bacterium]